MIFFQIEIDMEANEATTSNPSVEEDDFEAQIRRMQEQAPVVPHTFSIILDDVEKMAPQRGEAVWQYIARLPLEVRQIANVLTAMPTTQVSVERLFSALKLLKSDMRGSLKVDLLNAMLSLRTNKF